jgi:hypothetical protein
MITIGDKVTLMKNNYSPNAFDEYVGKQAVVNLVFWGGQFSVRFDDGKTADCDSDEVELTR